MSIHIGAQGSETPRLEPLTCPAAHLLDEVLMIDSAEEIKEVLRSPVFEQATGPVGTPFRYHDAINYIDGTRHLTRRRIEAPLFNEESLSAYKEEALAPSIQQSLRELLDEADEDGIIRTDLIPLMWRILYRVAARLIGLDDIDSRARIDELIDIAQALTEALSVEWAPADRVEEITRRGLEAQERYRVSFFGPSAERRRDLIRRVEAGELPEEALPRDLVTALYRSFQDDWDEDTPFRECSMYLVGSTSSSAQAVPHFLVILDRWLDEHPDERHLVLDDPTFLRRAASESLRFFLSNPVRFRRATADVTLKSGRTIAAGTIVGVNFKPANMEPELFGDDADVFNPFREVRGPRWGLAFGSGPHACIGRPLVTGTGGVDGADGSMAATARALYRAGFQIDRSRSIQIDEERGKRVYREVPMILTSLSDALE